MQTPEMKRKPVSKTVSSSSSSRRNKKGRQPNQLATKDLGRWKPTDDLALIIGVQQTNDLRTVHLGTKFSCKFTVQELQQRWYALLYDQAVSRVAVSAMRNLHPDMIAAVQDKALWSQAEEQALSTVKSVSCCCLIRTHSIGWLGSGVLSLTTKATDPPCNNPSILDNQTI